MAPYPTAERLRTPRREFSAATRRAAWERADGFCEGLEEEPGCVNAHDRCYLGPPCPYCERRRCNAPIDIGNFHYDHIDPDWISKDNELENCQVLCRECHKRKTKRDIKDIAKVKRIRDKLIKARKPKGRPMPGTRRSGIRKRMSGKLEHW